MSTIRPPRELVLASAGSGKTYRISSRLVGLLAAGVEPEHLLASTFTRKAAGQILDRILARLARAALDADEAAMLATAAALDENHRLPADPGFWQEILRATVRRLHRLNVGTLDSFFLKAARAFEAELGLTAGWRVPEEHISRALRSKALQQVLAGAERDELAEAILLAGRGAARRSVQLELDRQMIELLEIDEQLDPDVSDPWRVFGETSAGTAPAADERERLAAALERVAVPLTRNGTERGSWRNALAAIAAALRVGDWEGLIRLRICQRVAVEELHFDREIIEGETLELLRSALELAARALRPILAGQVAALGALTRSFGAHYRALQRTEGLFGFADVTRLIGSGDSLGSRADLYYRLDARTRHLLLDEFQDTSMAQWEAMRPIVDEVLSDADRAAVIVADPKQSIYGWRGAEPALVHAVGDRYSLDDEYLAASYRSSQVVLDFVNTVFAGIEDTPCLANDLDAVREWARDFKPHEAKKRLPGFATFEVGPQDERRGGPRPLLMQSAADRVAQLRETCGGFSIGVLTATNAAVAHMFLELREREVPVSQEGGNPLTDSAACEAVLALLRLADHPGDTIARYHVASCPLGTVVGLSDHGDLPAATRVAARVRLRLLNDGYGRVVTEIAAQLRAYCDARDARRLGQLVELGHRFDQILSLRPGDFVRFVELQRVEDRSTADVRVMTIHQAKGLEFDIVVLPQLDQSLFGGRNDAPVLPYRPTPAGRYTAVYPSVAAEMRCLFPEVEGAYRQRRAARLRDGLSGLYVGLTRARYGLHLIAAPDGKSGPGKTISCSRIVREALAGHATPRPISAGDRLHSSGREDWYRDPTATPDGTGSGAPPAVETVQVRLRAGGPPRLLPTQSPSGLHDDGRVDVRALLSLDSLPALRRGSVVHALFEQIGWIEDPVPGDEALRDAITRVAPGAPLDWQTSIISEFHAWIADPRIGRALSRSRYAGDARVEREVPFMVRRENVIMEGVIDRLVVSYAEGRPVSAEVLDFKTDRITAEQVPESIARYASQLAAYTEAVSEIYGIRRQLCQAALVFLEPGRIEPIASEPQITTIPS